MLAAALSTFLGFGSLRWARRTRQLLANLEAARRPEAPRVVDFAELDGLPAPVRRYFETVLRPGQPHVNGVRARHAGTFNLSEEADRWRPFTSQQRVILRRPGFVWDAKIKLLPALSVRVHDAYIAGEGILRAALFGWLTVARLRGNSDLARGELMRFFAEATWYPTALLPSQGVQWEAVDDRSARATLADGAVTLTLLFGFDEAGLIHTVRAEARGRSVGKQMIPTPWEGRFWNYQERAGLLIPLDGEVAWLLPEGEKPYWRGRLTEIAYDT